MIKKSNIKYKTYVTSKFYMNLFVYSNIFQYEYPFVSYSYHFFYTNIFGYSFVKNHTHLSPSVHQVKRRIQERRQQHWMPCLTPLPSPILFSENIFPVQDNTISMCGMINIMTPHYRAPSLIRDHSERL